VIQRGQCHSLIVWDMHYSDVYYTSVWGCGFLPKGLLSCEGVVRVLVCGYLASSMCGSACPQSSKIGVGGQPNSSIADIPCSTLLN
jgi:hypothetical protein